ncbi:MAG: hypothetical protein AAGD14_09780 [Planctomycetota bacterium]
MTAVLALLLAGSLYALPDGAAPPAPTPAQATRIEQALAELQKPASVRTLALIGRAALPAVVERLNEADASDRVLLLHAVSRLPEAKTLLEQATRDPDPTVRASLRPPTRARLSLARLAARYVGLLVLLDNPAYEVVKPEPEPPSYELRRRHMGDEVMDRAVSAEYRSVSWEFARAGAEALRSGTLKPDLDDTVFAAYVALLYDEEVAAAMAAEGIVATGAAAIEPLTTLLAHKEHDPRLIGRLLVAVGGGARLYAAKGRGEKLQRARVELATRALSPGEVVAFLSATLEDESARVRKEALRLLVELRAKVDPSHVIAQAASDEELAYALVLSARNGARQPMFDAVAESGRPRRAFSRALRLLTPEEQKPFLAALRASDDPALVWMGIDGTRDVAVLLAFARATQDARLREHAVRGAIEQGDLSGLALVASPSSSTLRLLCAGGFVDELMSYAMAEDADLSRAALTELRHLPTLDAKHAPALQGLYERLPEPYKWDALDAMVPLGGEVARKAMLDAGLPALSALGVAADDGRTLDFSIPLKPFLEGADAQRLQRIARVAGALPEVEPGLFLDLLAAWDALEIDETMVEGGAPRQKLDALRLMVRTRDLASIRALFADAVTGKLRDEAQLVPILQAASRQLTPKELGVLVPVLEREVMMYVPDEMGSPPREDPRRDFFVWYAMRALAYRQVPAALPFFCSLALEPKLQRERYDEQAGRPLPYDWTQHAVESLRHYPAPDVVTTLDRVIADMEGKGTLAEISVEHLFRLVDEWRDNAWRGRRLHGFALTMCALIDRLPFEGETGVTRMLALGAQRRYAEAAAEGLRAAERVRARGYRPADGHWSPKRIVGRARIYEALTKGTIPALGPTLGDVYLEWVAAIYLRFLTTDQANAVVAADFAWKNSAWLHRDARNLRADLFTVQGDAPRALALLKPSARLPAEVRQDEGWWHYYLARAYAAAGKPMRAQGELAEALRLNRRLIASCKADPLLKDFAEVYRQVDEDWFDQLFG